MFSLKLVHKNLEHQMDLKPGKGCLWVIESPEQFREYVQDLYKAITAGEESSFILSLQEKEQELSLSKSVELITDPFSIDLNDRRIQKKLYTELEKLACGEMLYIQTQKILSSLQEYFFQIEEESEYCLEADLNIDITNIMKASGIRLAVFGDTFLEKLIQYIKIMAGVLEKKLIIFVNLCSYLNNSQLSQILETAAYNEIALLLIENHQKDFPDSLSYYIIDKDGCEIY